MLMNLTTHGPLTIHSTMSDSSTVCDIIFLLTHENCSWYEPPGLIRHRQNNGSTCYDLVAIASVNIKWCQVSPRIVATIPANSRLSVAIELWPWGNGPVAFGTYEYCIWYRISYAKMVYTWSIFHECATTCLMNLFLNISVLALPNQGRRIAGAGFLASAARQVVGKVPRYIGRVFQRDQTSTRLWFTSRFWTHDP